MTAWHICALYWQELRMLPRAFALKSKHPKLVPLEALIVLSSEAVVSSAAWCVSSPCRYVSVLQQTAGAFLTLPAGRKSGHIPGKHDMWEGQAGGLSFAPEEWRVAGGDRKGVGGDHAAPNPAIKIALTAELLGGDLHVSGSVSGTR